MSDTNSGAFYDPPIAAYLRETVANRQKPNKIAAIKALRDATGFGLKNAKDAVEEYGRRNGIEPLMSPGGSDSGTPAVILEPGVCEATIADYLRGNEAKGEQPGKIGAILALRKKTGLGLKVAKETVEDYGRRHGIEALNPTGNLKVTTVLFFGLILVAIIAGVYGYFTH